MPLKYKLLLIIIPILILFGIVMLTYGYTTFSQEVEFLYGQDFQERLRNIGIEYTDVDAVSGASDAAVGARQEVLDRLERKYVDLDDVRVQPWIINGDGETILNVGPALPDSLIEEVSAGGEGETVFDDGSDTYWTMFFYFEPWDWYTGYRVKESVMNAQIDTFVIRMVITIIAAILLMSAFLYVFVSRTLRPLAKVGQTVSKAAGGDLTGKSEVFGSGDIGKLSANVRLMIGSIAELVRDIGSQASESGDAEKELFESSNLLISTAQEAGNGTREIRNRIKGLESGIEDGSRAAEAINKETDELVLIIERTGNTVGEATSRVDALASGVQEIGARASGSMQLTESLRNAVRDGVQQMARTEEAVGGVLSRLGEIQELASMIGDLGDQTNLLAMNASIEAAHAGDAGRGFSVVAGEIRKLAEQTGNRASGIDQVIRGVGEAVAAAGETSRDANKAISRIDTIADEMGEFLVEVTGKVGELGDESVRIRRDTESLRKDSQSSIEGSRKVNGESRRLRESVASIAVTAAEVSRFIEEVESRLAENEGTLDGMEGLIQRLHGSMTRLSEGIKRFTV